MKVLVQLIILHHGPVLTEVMHERMMLAFHLLMFGSTQPLGLLSRARACPCFCVCVCVSVCVYMCVHVHTHVCVCVCVCVCARVYACMLSQLWSTLSLSPYTCRLPQLALLEVVQVSGLTV